MKLFENFENNGFEYAIADAPLLFESGMDKICYKTVAVVADEDIRANRIMARDGISREFALNRIRVQMSAEELKKRCDFVIYNNTTLDELDDAVRKTAYEIRN